MTDKTPDNKISEQEKAELVKNLKTITTPILRNLARTGTIYFLGRKFAPETFSSFGRTYAFVLLIDMLKSKRFITTPANAVVESVNINNVSADDLTTSDSGAVRLKSTSFQTSVPTSTKGCAKGDRWYVLSKEDVNSQILEMYVFDGTKWVKQDTGTKPV